MSLCSCEYLTILQKRNRFPPDQVAIRDSAPDYPLPANTSIMFNFPLRRSKDHDQKEFAPEFRSLDAAVLCGGVMFAQAPVVNIDSHKHPNLAGAQGHIVEAYQLIVQSTEREPR